MATYEIKTVSPHPTIKESFATVVLSNEEYTFLRTHLSMNIDLAKVKIVEKKVAKKKVSKK